MSNKKVYTGIHLLESVDSKEQFGMVDSWASFPDLEPVLRICFNKSMLSKAGNEEDIVLELNLIEASNLANTIKSVEERIRLLVILAKRGKLTEDAYYIE